MSVATDTDSRYDDSRPRLSTFCTNGGTAGIGSSATLRRPSGYRPIAVPTPCIGVPNTATLPNRRLVRHHDSRQRRAPLQQPSQPGADEAKSLTARLERDETSIHDSHLTNHTDDSFTNRKYSVGEHMSDLRPYDDSSSDRGPSSERGDDECGIIFSHNANHANNNQFSSNNNPVQHNDADGIYNGDLNPYSRPLSNRTLDARQTPVFFSNESRDSSSNHYKYLPSLTGTNVGAFPLSECSTAALSPHSPQYMSTSLKSAPLASSDTTVSSPQSSCDPGDSNSSYSDRVASPQYMATSMVPASVSSAAPDDDIYKQRRLLNLPARALRNNTKGSDYSTPSIIYSQRTGVKIAGLTPSNPPPPPPPPPPPSTINPPIPPFHPHLHKIGREPSAPR